MNQLSQDVTSLKEQLTHLPQSSNIQGDVLLMMVGQNGYLPNLTTQVGELQNARQLLSQRLQQVESFQTNCFGQVMHDLEELNNSGPRW